MAEVITESSYVRRGESYLGRQFTVQSDQVSDFSQATVQIQVRGAFQTENLLTIDVDKECPQGDTIVFDVGLTAEQTVNLPTRTTIFAVIKHPDFEKTVAEINLNMKD